MSLASCPEWHTEIVNMVRFVWSAAFIAMMIVASSGAVKAQDTTESAPQLEKTFLQLSGMG